MKKTVANELIAAKEKIEKLRKTDSLIFPLFADLHTVSAQHECAEKLYEVLSAAAKEIPFDMAINLGDNLEMLGRNMHITNPELKALLTELFDRIDSCTDCPVIFVNGNHDAPGTDFFKPEFWNGITKNKYGNKDATYSDEGSYFYIDYKKADTRLVFLSLPSDSDIEADNPAPVWAFGQPQLKWLRDEALDTEGYVIIIIHVPFYYKYLGNSTYTIPVWDGEKEAESYIKDLCGVIADCDEAAAVIREFDKKNPQRLIAAFSGHTHADSVWMPFEEKGGLKNPLPCPQIVSRRLYTGYDEDAETDFAFDIAVWTPSEMRLDVIRMGEGEDKSFVLK